MTVRDGGEYVGDRQRISEGDRGRSPFVSQANRRALQALDRSENALEVATNLQSDNYDPGVAGWKLDRDTGDLEANDAILRGALEAAGGIVDIDASGIDITEGTGVANEVNFVDGSDVPTARIRKLTGGGLEVNAEGGVFLGGGPWGPGFHDVYTSGRFQLGSHSSLSGLIWDGMTIPEPAGVKASRGSGMNIPSGAVTQVYLDTEDWQYGDVGEADRGLGFLELGEGIWLITAELRLNGTGSASRVQAQIEIGAALYRQEHPGNAATKLVSFSTVHANTSGGVEDVYLRAFQDSGNTHVAEGSALTAVRLPVPVP